MMGATIRAMTREMTREATRAMTKAMTRWGGRSVEILMLLAGLAVSVGPPAAQAQAPRARVSLLPGAVVTVGQPITIRVQVLVPSFFAGAPAFPELDVEDAITIFVDRGTNFTEREGGATWAGQDRSYTVYPQRAGAFEVGEIVVEVRYRGDAGLVTATATSPPVRFEARIPAEAAGLDYFIAAGATSSDNDITVPLPPR